MAGRNAKGRTNAAAALEVLACCVAAAYVFASSAFVGGAGAQHLRSRVVMEAEAPAPAPAPSSSVALVKVTEENAITTASVLPGLLGLLVGGVWVGGALFAAGAYLSRQKSDVATGLKGIAGGSLEVLNFGAYVNDKYEISGKLGSAFKDALDNAKAGSNKEAANSVSSAIDGVSEAVAGFDKDVGIKDTLGSLFTSASDLASQAVEKVIEVNEEYKLTDQLMEKVNETMEKSKK